VSETEFRLRRAVDGRLAAAGRAVQALERRLEARDQRRRLGIVKSRHVAADGALARTARASVHRAELRVRTLAGRLDTLSPLAVLGRGYAVCFAGDGATILRDAAAVAVGESVRVRLARGTLACEVTDTRSTDEGPPDATPTPIVR